MIENTKLWKPTIIGSSLNLRIQYGKSVSDYKLMGIVADTQLYFKPDIICNYEDMEGCDSREYNKTLSDNYFRTAATDDKNNRGVSCWVKNEYSVKKIYSMNDPHFMHLEIKNKSGIVLNLIIIRILVSNSTDEDFKARNEQWNRTMYYLDSIIESPNIALIGDWNHGAIAKTIYYKGKPREFFNFQIIEKTLKFRNIRIVPIEGYSKDGYLKIDHLALTSSIKVENARYELVNIKNNNIIGIPDHKYIVANLEIERKT